MSDEIRCVSRDSSPPPVDFDEKAIDRVFARVNQQELPGVAVGIAIDGKFVYRKGFGLASMELPVQLSPTTRMRIGSNTKQFTALAYMLLCEEGRADLDGTVGQYLPELHRITHQVTARQLMGNTGGLRDAPQIKLIFSGMETPAISADELMTLYRVIDDANSPPGTAWKYNNGGFLILSAIIERICDEPLEQVFGKRIFRPIGMDDTLFRRWDTDFVPNSATNHMTRKGGGWIKANYGMDNFSGAGAIASTADDMLRWLAHMRTPIVGSARTWNLMTTPQLIANGTSTGYGLGLLIGEYRGVEVVHHGGGGIGCNAQALTVPSAALDIVVLANRDDVSSVALTNQILDSCLKDLEVPPKAKKKRILEGAFRSLETGTVIQLFGSGDEQIASINGFDVPFEEDGANRLGPRGAAKFLKQTVTPIGDPDNPTSIRFSDFGNLQDLVRLKPVDSNEIGSIVGRYESKATSTEATITVAESGARLRTAGRFGSAEFGLKPLGFGVWRVSGGRLRDFSAIVSFDGNCDGFLFSDASNVNLRFERGGRQLQAGSSGSEPLIQFVARSSAKNGLI